MMTARMTELLTGVTIICAGCALAYAGVPLPDVVLNGTVSINGQQQTATDNVTIIARVEGVPEPVGVYPMGQSSTAGDYYVLRIRLESGADGSDQSHNAARLGQTVNIYIKQGPAAEQLVTSIVVSSPGTVERRDLNTSCSDTVRPTIYHERPESGPRTIPCSGYIDPRFDSNNGETVNLGLDEVVVVFNERVQTIGAGGALTTDSFSAVETGAALPPTVSIDASPQRTFVDGATGRHQVTLKLSRPITVQEWTTIIANVEDTCGNPIDSSGNQQGQNEPDRIDIGFLPGNIDQNDVSSPIDITRAQQFFLGTCLPGNCPDCGGAELYFDTDRNGAATPIDITRVQQLFRNLGNASRNWNGERMNHPRP